MSDVWYRCSECRTEIPFGGMHYVCSVSTCNRARMKLVFCSVVCWDSHLSSVRHRDAGAIEARAPGKEQWQREQAAEAAASAPAAPTPSTSSAPVVRRMVGDAASNPVAPAGNSPGQVTLATVTDKDVLIVVSKLKKYIKDRSGFNCSDAVAEHLSEHVRAVADEAIRNAARDERKTVLDRDVPRRR